ncbi:fibroblast growth factor receptor 3-like isoform X4 [Acropora muricata]|uniref:fibroblast growth factor receptor 3-like isoform X4 n=1 Tax=Acropora muricata TaxID=159855 RepID=UPI0034E4AE96
MKGFLVIFFTYNLPFTAETAITAFSNIPSNPTFAEEGKRLAIVWTYTIDGTVFLAQFFNVTGGGNVRLGKTFGTGNITIASEYQERFSGQVTNTKAELTILKMQRSQQLTCRFLLNPTGSGILTSDVEIIVQFQPRIIATSGNHTLNEGENATLKCLADGNPTPKITWTRLFDNKNIVMPMTNIKRQDAGRYRCTADNGIGKPVTGDVWIVVQYSVQAIGSGENVTVAGGVAKTLTCPVDGNPEPKIEWYNKKTGRKITSGNQLEPRESGCYTCVASNSLGTSVNITQCLIIFYECSTTVPSTTVSGVNESSTTVHPTTVSAGHEIRATLTIIANYEQTLEDLNSTSSRHFVAKFVKEMDKIYMNMPEYIRTEVTQLRPGSVIVHFTLYFKTAVTPEKGIDNLRVAISSNGSFGSFQAWDLVLNSEESTKSTATTGAIGNKRPYEVAEERDAGFYDNEIVMKDVNPTHLRPTISTQEQVLDELEYLPLHGISSTGEGYISPVSPVLNVEYAPLDIRTRSWEVERNDVKVDKIIGKGAFGQVAKGKAKNLPLRTAATIVAIKMVKADAPESDKRDLKSELELMKTLKPHPHVINLLGCVTESEPLLVLIEYVACGDLLGYLRKSRGLNDTYYKDPDIKPKTSLTSQQLMKFAWQIADGMSYLSLRKVVHRDLAARNVLVGERETCKITDFGMARDVQQENIYERKTKGRLPVKWTAYESLLYGQYTTKSDVWSYGIVLYEISTIGGSPYPRMEGRKIVDLLRQGYRMPKPEHVDDDLIMASRFADINSVEQFIEDQENENTRKKTQQNVALLEEFLTLRNESRLIEEISPKELNAYTTEFIITVRKKDGNEDYEPSSLRSLMASFERYLKKKNYGFSIMKDAKFEQARKALQSKQKDLKHKGKGNKPNASVALTEEEIKLLYDKELLGTSTPEALLNTIWFNNTIHFGLRKVRNTINVCWGDVQLRQTTNGEEFLEYSERQTKTRTGENPEMLDKLNRKCSRFLEVKKIPLLPTNYTQRNDQQK